MEPLLVPKILHLFNHSEAMTLLGIPFFPGPPLSLHPQGLHSMATWGIQCGGIHYTYIKLLTFFFIYKDHLNLKQ
jgi:hypothetical protein